MEKYYQISPEDLNHSPFRLIGTDWMLITVPDKNKESGANAMTASWGGLGVLWNKPVATIYVRPQRYTFSLLEQNDRLSLCFFDKKYKNALGFCGKKSGRELDKIKECSLNTEEIDRVSVIKEAEIIMICKKLYADDLKKENFIEKEHLSHYDNDFHRFYILEVEKILARPTFPN